MSKRAVQNHTDSISENLEIRQNNQRRRVSFFDSAQKQTHDHS